MIRIVRVDPRASMATLSNGLTVKIDEMTNADGEDVGDLRYARTFRVWTAPEHKGGQKLFGVVSDYL